MERISEHISWAEATRYKNNIPNSKQLENMKKLAEAVFEPIRNYFNVPIYIWSFFRSKSVNKSVKGARASQHLCLKGAAIDIDSQIYGGTTNADIAEYIIENLEFDQLILEHINEDGEPDWLHISYNEGNNRNQILIAYKDGKEIKYKNITHAIKEFI